MFYKTNEKLIEALIKDGFLKTPSIIKAFQEIDRALFVPEEKRKEAYVNHPLPIGFDQTISQPLIVAFMLELLQPKKGEKILDIGSGSGWQTALLAHIVGGLSLNEEVNEPDVFNEEDRGCVVAVERVPELAKMTYKNISKFNFIEKNIVKIAEGDGSRGAKAEAPFDKIIAAAAAKKIPSAWKEQLKINGKIVAPVENSVYVLTKKDKKEFFEKQYFGVSFVPLIIGD